MNKGPLVDPSVARRRFWIRAALVAAFIGLGVLVFILGKGHSLLVDNKDADDGSVAGLDGVTVSIDGGEPSEMYSGDRDMAKVTGQTHRVVIETMEGEKIERTIKMPIGRDMLLLSIPMLVAGKEPVLVPFTPRDVAPPEDTAGNTNEFVAPLGPDVVVPGEASVDEAAGTAPAPSGQ